MHGDYLGSLKAEDITGKFSLFHVAIKHANESHVDAPLKIHSPNITGS